MDTITMIRLAAGVVAVLVIGVIVWRRKNQASH